MQPGPAGPTGNVVFHGGMAGKRELLITRQSHFKEVLSRLNEKAPSRLPSAAHPLYPRFRTLSLGYIRTWLSVLPLLSQQKSAFLTHVFLAHSTVFPPTVLPR